MYKREGVVNMAMTFTGFLSLFNLKLGYDWGGTFDSHTGLGYYFGTTNQFDGMDCSGYFDWLCQCVGLDVWDYVSFDKYFYALIDDIDKGYDKEDTAWVDN